jgi:hypothetical protein
MARRAFGAGRLHSFTKNAAKRRFRRIDWRTAPPLRGPNFYKLFISLYPNLLRVKYKY